LQVKIRVVQTMAAALTCALSHLEERTTAVLVHRTWRC